MCRVYSLFTEWSDGSEVIDGVYHDRKKAHVEGQKLVDMHNKISDKQDLRIVGYYVVDVNLI